MRIKSERNGRQPEYGLPFEVIKIRNRISLREYWKCEQSALISAQYSWMLSALDEVYLGLMLTPS